jgi:NAD(P)H-dependent FMN reductase
MTILLINGSYRDDGITDQALQRMVQTLESGIARVDEIVLRERPIEFCHNCRACTQSPGPDPGHCVIDDDMHRIVADIERADAIVLAAPTNFGSVTAVFKRFMERLVVYAYWPWEQAYPEYRKPAVKPALLVSSSAAPGVLGRWMFGSVRQLNTAARTMGARPVGTLFTGTIAATPGQQLPAPAARRAERLAGRLLQEIRTVE